MKLIRATPLVTATALVTLFLNALAVEPVRAAESPLIPPRGHELPCELGIIARTDGVLTMDPQGTRADALAIASGRIVAIGDSEKIRHLCRNDRMIELADTQTVLPGFIDSHSHFLPYGIAKSPSWIDVSSANPFFADPGVYKPVLSQDDLRKTIRDSPQFKDAKILLGAGYDASRTASGEDPDLAFMNSIDDKRPIFVWDASMHSVNINQPMIDLILEGDLCGTGSCPAPKDEKACMDCLESCTDVPKPYRQSFCNGLLEETMLQKVLTSLSSKASGQNAELLETPLMEALELAGATYAAHGFTTGSDVAFGGMLKAYRHLPDVLPLDMVVSPTTVKARQELERAARDKPWLYAGPIKTWADGSIQGRTAFVRGAMLGDPITHGDMTNPNYVLAGFIEKAFLAGYPVAVHTNGDAAIDVTLDLIEAAMTRYPEARSLRNVFIHAPMVDRRHLERMAALNAIPTFLIQHPYFWGQPICQSILGPARTSRVYNPAGLAAQVLPRFAFHSDAFVTPPDPLRMIWAGTTRKVQDVQYLREEGSGYTDACPEYLAQGQRVTIERALRALTLDAAYQFSLEHEKGSLELGKLADVTILSKDPLNMESDPNELLEIDVLATIQRGRCFSWSDGLTCPPSTGSRKGP